MRAFVDAYAGRPAGVAFRTVADDDRDWLRALYAGTRAEELRPVPWPEAAKQAFLAEQFALQDRHYRAHYPGADLLLILMAGERAGRVYVYRSASEIRLMDIALDPALRGRGLGTALMQELFAEARETARAITLHVEPVNPARRWYERLGFTLIEDRGVNWFMGWRPDASVPLSPG